MNVYLEKKLYKSYFYKLMNVFKTFILRRDEFFWFSFQEKSYGFFTLNFDFSRFLFRLLKFEDNLKFFVTLTGLHR